MKQYVITFLLALLPVTLLLLTACSDDGPSGPSNIIAQIEVYKGSEGVLNRHSVYNFTYDGRKRVSRVRTSYLNQEIDYTYDGDNFSYRWIKDNESDEGTSFVNRFEASLGAGRVNIGKSTLGNYVYFYMNKGYLKEVSVGADKSLNYDWGKASLKIMGEPSLYETEYNYSHVANDYSFDLNVLSQLIDERENYVEVVNTYGQLAGVLGTKYPYILENADYSYKYSYDQRGRLTRIEQIPTSHFSGKRDSYEFRLIYDKD